MNGLNHHTELAFPSLYMGGLLPLLLVSTRDGRAVAASCSRLCSQIGFPRDAGELVEVNKQLLLPGLPRVRPFLAIDWLEKATTLPRRRERCRRFKLVPYYCCVDVDQRLSWV